MSKFGIVEVHRAVKLLDKYGASRFNEAVSLTSRDCALGIAIALGRKALSGRGHNHSIVSLETKVNRELRRRGVGIS